MGFPTSGILAKIFISHLEQKYILNSNKNKYAHNICRYRYVDDLLFLFTSYTADESRSAGWKLQIFIYFHRDLSAPAMSTNMSQVGVALFPSF